MLEAARLHPPTTLQGVNVQQDKVTIQLSLRVISVHRALYGEQSAVPGVLTPVKELLLSE